MLLWTVRVCGIWVLTCSLAHPVISSALCYESSTLVMCHQEERLGLLFPQLLVFHLRKNILPAFLILFPLSLMSGAVFLVDAAERSESLFPHLSRTLRRNCLFLIWQPMNTGTWDTPIPFYSWTEDSIIGGTNWEDQGLPLPQCPVGITLGKVCPLPTGLVQWCIDAFPGEKGRA